MSIKPGQVAAALDAGFLNLILFPTEQCNFRCTYCYEDFNIGRMKPTVVESVKALLTRRASSLETLHISWFGGEPLLAKPVVYDISTHAQMLAGQMSLSYMADMTTNGYLLDRSTAERLVGLGVTSYQISLDGPEKVHDRTRIKANGAGSFSQIWNNLIALRDSDLTFAIKLRIHFSPDTVLVLDPLIDDLNREFAHDFRFSVYFKSIERLGGPNDSATRLFSEELLDEAKRYLDGKLNDKSQISSLTADDEPYICYAAKPNSLAIRANGDVVKCTVALYDERNRVGKLKSDGTLSIDQVKVRGWLRGFRDLDERELACPYSAMNDEVKGRRDREEEFGFEAPSTSDTVLLTLGPTRRKS